MRFPVDTFPLCYPIAKLLMVAAVLLSGCDVVPPLGFQKSVAPSPAAVSKPRVNVIEIVRDDNAFKTLIILGKLKAARQSQLGFGRGGSVKEVFKQIGDRLQLGDALAELNNAELKSQKQTAEQALIRLKNEIEAPRATPVSTLQQQVKQVEDQLKTLDLQIATGVIEAPYPCVVVQRNVEVGTLVSPSTPAFQVIEDAPPLVESSLTRPVAALINTGQSVYVKVDNEVVLAKLTAKSPMLDPTASQRVLFEFSDDLPSKSWAYGKVVEIRARARTNVSGFWLPLSALQREANGLWSVFVPVSTQKSDDSDSDSEFEIERRILEIVQLENESALVQGALSSGEFVVMNGIHRIVPGQQVDPVNVSEEFDPPFSTETDL